MAEDGKTSGRPGGRRRTRGTLHAVPTPPANRKPRLAPEKAAELDRLLADMTLGRNDIARRAGVSPDTVSRRAEAVGRSFDVSAVRVAHEVRVMDGRAKRRALAEALLDDASDEARLRAQIGGNDAQARASLSRSIGTLVKAVADLDSIEVRYRELEREKRQGSDIDEWLTSMGVGTGTE